MEPGSLKYQKSHEWTAVEGDIVTIGISPFAVELLTDLVYIELPEMGKTFSVGDVFGEVESVKAVSDLYAPVSGQIVEVNSPLADDLAMLSEDPLGKGWIVKLKMSNPAELDNLLDLAAYEALCASEGH